MQNNDKPNHNMPFLGNNQNTTGQSSLFGNTGQTNTALFGNSTGQPANSGQASLSFGNTAQQNMTGQTNTGFSDGLGQNTAPQNSSLFGHGTTSPFGQNSQILDQKDKNSMPQFNPSQTTKTSQDGLEISQHGSGLNESNHNQTAQNTTTENDNKNIVDISSIPLTFPQMTISEILSSIEERLDKDVENYKSKAEKIFALDNKIIRARNNYVKLMERVKKEEEGMAELEENVDFLEKWVKDIATTSDRSTYVKNTDLSEIQSVEQQFDDLVAAIRDKNDIDTNLQGIVSENMRLLKSIDEEMEQGF